MVAGAQAHTRTGTGTRTRHHLEFVNQLHRELYSADFLDEPSKLTLTEWMAEIDYRLVEGGGEQIQLDALTAQIVNLLK